MMRWQFRNLLGTRQFKSGPKYRTCLRLEVLEDRSLMSVTPIASVPGLSAEPGYAVTKFATSPSGASQPDSIAVDGNNVFVGFGNGVAKDGSDGLSSTIVEYTSTGALLQTFSVPGHNDGLKVDPATHRVWALQNEDGNPNLVVIDPVAATQTQYSFGPVANGGGFDDISFLNNKVFLSESNPSNNPNTAPAVVVATLNNTNHTVAVKTVLTGNATALNLVTKQKGPLNLQDPDSMTADPSGNLVLTSQVDDEIVTIHHPGQSNQSVTVLPLSDASQTPVSVDDSLFPPNAPGSILMTDLTTGTIYRITGQAINSHLVLSAAVDIGELGQLNTNTGLFTPIITGLGSPRGLAFLPRQVAPGYKVEIFATNPSNAFQPDSIAVDGNNVFVGFANGVAKDGSDGLSSTIVQYTPGGGLVQTFSVPGHNDGLKVDPATHLLWALQNEDGNPNLVIIDPIAVTQTQYTFAPVANGGGFDDITFLNSKVFLSESNPSNNPNTDPAVVEATLNNTDNTVAVTTVLTGNATAFNLITHQQVNLNLQDPDSMTADLAGNLVLTSQADDEIVTIHHPGQGNQFATVVPLFDASQMAVSVDDSLFPPNGPGTMLLTDQGSGVIYEITGPGIGSPQAISALASSQAFSAALDIGKLGRLNVKTGLFAPIISGLSSPRGLAFQGGPDTQ